MAIKNIGRILSAGAIAFCVVLFCSLSISGQQFVPKKKTFTISGSVGLSGVTMSGLPSSVITDENGYYSATVDFNWSGKVRPIKAGYTFDPEEKPYNNVRSNYPDQNYTFEIKKFVISGSVGQPGVVMTGIPGSPVSGSDGIYKGVVEYGWSGSVIPELTGYTFTPLSKPYTDVDRNYTNENYKATPITFTISGSVGVGGVEMKGLPQSTVSDPSGNYSAVVPYGWIGTVKPEKAGYNFNPTERPYANIISSQTYQDYIPEAITFTISGTTGEGGVTLKGLPNEPLSNIDGTYIAIVPYNFKGKVTPEKAGFTFKPPSKTYSDVTSDYEAQDYFAEAITYTISGNVGKEGVLMNGLPGTPISGSDGSYRATVSYDWSGTAEPQLIGYTFTPPRKLYPRITKDETQDYTAVPITFTISGSTGIVGVLLKGLPIRVMSDENGNYSALVPYGWQGTVEPEKEGYNFNPPDRQYPPLISAAVDQDYIWTLQKRNITGKVISVEGFVEGVHIFADNGGGSTKTDINGVYQLSVDYGWSGTITPDKQGLTFKPSSKQYPRVIRDTINQDYTAEKIMLTISGTLPLEGVLMSVSEGGIADTTDANGHYSVKVPYNWSGEIKPILEGYDFDPASIPYNNVTTDYVNGEAVPRESKPKPKLPSKPITSQEPTMPTSTQTVHPPKTTTRGVFTQEEDMVEVTTIPQEEPGTQEDTFEQQKELLEQQLGTLQGQMDDLLNQLSRKGMGTKVPQQVGPSVPEKPATGIKEQVIPGIRGIVPQSPIKVPTGPLVSIVCVDTDIRDVLRYIEGQTGVKIYTDDTVKGKVTCQFRNKPLEEALEEVLKGTDFAFKEIPNSYLVYKPINNAFADTQLRDALMDIATSAGVVIIPDETVSGVVTARLEQVDLDTALDIVLAGTSYVVKKTPYYYLIASSKVDDAAFLDVSETRRIRMNYIAADVAVGLLSTAFRPYVQIEASRDPRTGAMISGQTILITAPANLLNRIVSDLKDIDRPPRHVLLDARIVVMERGDLLNLGVEWGWPKIRAGVFGSDFRSGGENDMQFHGKWPWGIQIGYTMDAAFTDSLQLTLNLLCQNSEADILSSPQVLAQDGHMAQLNVMNEEYYYLSAPERAGYYTEAQLQQIDAGTRIEITPRIGDNNDITLDIVAEVSDVVSRGEQTDETVPLVTVSRRTATNTVRVKDGGTVAVAGLTENRTVTENSEVPGLSKIPLLGELFKNKRTQQSSKEIAVFITARLVSESQELIELSESAQQEAPAEPVGEEEFRMRLRQSMLR